MKLTKDILGFYKNNLENTWYLKKHFSNKGQLGLYAPGATNAVDSKPDGSSFIGTVDEINTYEINALGFRGKVYDNAEVLASGCSLTFGLGVPELGRWTNFLESKLNKSVMNIANPGASVATVCSQIIQYCMNNKMPKEIFCLMPDFFRNMVVVDKEFYESKIDRKKVKETDQLQLMFCNPRVFQNANSVVMQITDKKYIEDYTSPHQLIMNSINYIYILESFCLINNIKLYWSTWDTSSALIMEELGNIEDFKLNNYTPLMLEDGRPMHLEKIGTLCSSDHESEFKDSICWPRGSDYSVVNYKKAPERAHPGIHLQYHVAEFFYNLYDKERV
jgi:hypothetical protein